VGDPRRRPGNRRHRRLPDAWRQPDNDEAVDALRIVAAELRVLLVELTGSVVVARLGQLAALRKWGIDFSDEGSRSSPRPSRPR
jgi:hypothetical protein